MALIARDFDLIDGPPIVLIANPETYCHRLAVLQLDADWERPEGTTQFPSDSIWQPQGAAHSSGEMLWLFTQWLHLSSTAQ